MTSNVIELTLPSDVATGGTFNVNYPSGTSRGTFLNGKVHKMIANQALFTAPKDFTVSFGATYATITYNGSTTLAAGSKVSVEFDAAGEDTIRGVNSNVTELKPVLVKLGSPITADADGIAASQSVTVGTTPLAVINGALAANGKVVFDVPRAVVAAWTGSAVLTVTGTDDYGQTLVEASASGTSLTGKKAFKTITSCSFSANVTGATIGTGNVLGLPVYVRDVSNVLAELKDGALIAGAPRGGARLNWFAEQVSVLAGTTANIELVAPFDGYIKELGVVTRVAVGTGGNVTAKIGTTDVAGLSVAVANSSTKGTKTTDTPTAGDASTLFNKGDRIQIVLDDAFATTGALDGYLDLVQTGVGSGTLVKGLSTGTKSTATTGDVRGTYTPETAPDGTNAYSLLLAIEDISFLGNPQYAG